MSDPSGLPSLPPPVMPSSLRDRVDAVAGALGVDPRRLTLVLGAAVVAAVAVAAVVVMKATADPAHVPIESSLPRAKSSSSADAPSDRASGPIVVAAAGAVMHSGVYRVAAGARVIDVIQAAGGATPDADLDRVNLAAKVGDGDRVYVPRRGEAAEPMAVGATAGGGVSSAEAIVDLNTATAEQLEALPGVGPATAKAIVDYRTQHRRFRSVNELLEVRGIGESKLAQIRPHVRVT